MVKMIKRFSKWTCMKKMKSSLVWVLYQDFLRLESLSALSMLILLRFIFLWQKGKNYSIQVLQYKVFLFSFSKPKLLRLFDFIWIRLPDKLQHILFSRALMIVSQKRQILLLEIIKTLNIKKWNLEYKTKESIESNI